MKKSLVALTAVLTMGICCSSALASDIDASLKVGYNLASSSESKVIITGEAPNVTITTPATGGGGLSITANVNANIMDNLGVSASVTGDYMSKKIESDQPEQRVAVTPTLVESFKKWTLSGDLLVNYSFINSIEGLNAGIQGGVNFVSTNVGDALIKKNMSNATAEKIKEKSNASGGAVVVGAFADYKINGKMNVSADGYVGLLKFGKVINPLSNYKVNAEFNYAINNDLDITGGITFASNVLSTEVNVSNIDSENIKTTVEYTYKQITPSIGVSYNF